MRTLMASRELADRGELLVPRLDGEARHPEVTPRSERVSLSHLPHSWHWYCG